MGGIGPVVVRSGEWAHRPVAVAATWRTRRTGLAPLPLGWGLLMGGCSVHGRGMCTALTVVGVDAAGVVIGAAVLRPGGLVRMAGAAAILELPVSMAFPDPGAVLAWAPLPAHPIAWPDS
ncbi:MAG: hypothetical protein H0V96_05440 [Acidimicrobiia bacterium]|nr:hypothetical protein [Acidimicrobiia bacterium]